MAPKILSFLILALLCQRHVALFSQASNNVIISLPEDLANCSKLMKLDVEVWARFVISAPADGHSAFLSFLLIFFLC